MLSSFSINFYWIGLTIIVLLLECFNRFSKSFSTKWFLSNIYFYGKSRRFAQGSRYVKDYQWFVYPKKLFYVFYLIAVIWFTYIEIKMFQLYCKRNKYALNPLSTMLKHLSAQNSQTFDINFINTQCTICMLICGLLIFHTARRLYECLYVHIFSPKSKVNILHLILGCTYYIVLGLTLLTMAPFFNDSRYTNHGDIVRLPQIQINLPLICKQNPVIFIGIVLFLACNWAQYKCHQILAGIRTNSQGRITNAKVYELPPHKFLFRWVSCPHYTCEIGIYLAISLIIIASQAPYWPAKSTISFFRYSQAWWFTLIFVITNQVCTALMQRDWARAKFGCPLSDASRKAIIPFVL